MLCCARRLGLVSSSVTYKQGGYAKLEYDQAQPSSSVQAVIHHVSRLHVNRIS